MKLEWRRILLTNPFSRWVSLLFGDGLSFPSLKKTSVRSLIITQKNSNVLRFNPTNLIDTNLLPFFSWIFELCNIDQQWPTSRWLLLTTPSTTVTSCISQADTKAFRPWGNVPSMSATAALASTSKPSRQRLVSKSMVPRSVLKVIPSPGAMIKILNPDFPIYLYIYIYSGWVMMGYNYRILLIAYYNH